jgi:hypothetical protein
MKLKFILFLITGLFLTVNFFAQGPKMPYKDAGACPFECCVYRQWTANKTTLIYKEMSEKSPVAFKVGRREKVTGVTGVVVTKKAGTVKALKNLTAKEFSGDFSEKEFSIKAGDIFYVLTSIGEGFYYLWYKGKLFQDQIDTQKNMKILTMPVADWWVKIKNRKGRIGWTKLPENFDNKDGCS